MNSSVYLLLICMLVCVIQIQSQPVDLESDQ